jgi:hypothetical protein
MPARGWIKAQAGWAEIRWSQVGAAQAGPTLVGARDARE